MKTAEQWREEMAKNTYPVTIGRNTIEAIQLDAFKAGMSEAAAIIRRSAYYHEPEYGNILAARDAKTET